MLYFSGFLLWERNNRPYLERQGGSIRFLIWKGEEMTDK